MNYKLLHIFQNTPFGRESMMQSLYFCRTIQAFPVIYIPETAKFLMYFSNDVLQIDLHPSYLTDPETARNHVEQLFEDMGGKPMFYEPKNFTSGTLPDISTRFDYLCCPRSVSDLSTKFKPGNIGLKVRRLINQAPFPILMTSPVFRPWKRICVFLGQTEHLADMTDPLQLGANLAGLTGFPLDVFALTDQPGSPVDADVQNIFNRNDGPDAIMPDWHFYDRSRTAAMMYDIPHDGLVIMGAQQQGRISEFLFGSCIDQVQAAVTNPLLVTGQHCSIHVSNPVTAASGSSSRVRDGL